MAMIEEGHYKAILENPEIGASVKKDTPCIHGIVKIMEDDSPHKGMRLSWEGWLTESAGERTIQSLIYAGCTFPPKPGETEPNLQDFTGCGSQEVDVQIEHEEYTPEPTAENPNPRTTKRARVAFINRLGAGRATKQIDENQKNLIAKSFGGLISKVRAGLGSAKTGDTSFDTKGMEAAAVTAEDGKKKKKLY